MAKPPVCRIMDYGNIKYCEAKKMDQAKLKLKQIQVKEVKFRPGTDEGDYLIKLLNLTAVPVGRRQGQDHARAFAGGKWRTRSSGCSAGSQAIRNDLEPLLRGRVCSRGSRVGKW